MVPSDAIRRVLLVIFLTLMVFQGVKLWATVVEVRIGQIEDPSEPTNFEDYVVFYAAGRMVLDGDGGSLYDLQAVRDAEHQVLGRPIDAPEDAEILPYFNPPFFAALMVSLAALPLDVSTAISFVVVCVLAAIGAWALTRFLGLRGIDCLIVAAWFLSWHSTAVAIAQTQLTMLALLAWLGFVVFEMRGQHRRSGLALALTLAKPQFLVLVIPLLIWQRRWRTLSVFASIAAVLGVISLIVAGPSVMVDYPKLLIESSRWEHEYSIDPSSMYGLGGFFRRTLGLYDLPLQLVLVPTTLATICCAAYSFSKGWHAERPDFAARAGVVLIASMLISFHFYRQDLAVMPLALVFGAWYSKQTTGTWGFWPFFAITGSVLQYLDINYLFEGGTNLQTLALAGLLIFLIVKIRRAELENQVPEDLLQGAARGSSVAA